MDGGLAPALLEAPTDDARSLTRIPVVAYATDAASLAVLEATLAPPLGERARFHQGGLAAARAGLQKLREPVAALIVDVSGEAAPLAALEALAMHVEPGVRVFVLGENADIDFYRQLTRGLGVVEYLAKPLTRDSVARGFLAGLVSESGATPVRGGRIVSVTGARGGVGATTVAVNLAARLAARGRHHTLLLDADLQSGSAGLLLAAGTAGSGLRAALENPGRVDPLFADRVSQRVSDRLSLLGGEEALDAVVEAPAGSGRSLTGLLCTLYTLIVLDLPRHPTALNAELRDAAHVRVIVMDPTLAALRDALRLLMLPHGPAQATAPLLVLNRAGQPGGLSERQVTDGLRRKPDVVIPWLPKPVQNAATLGQPLAGKRGPFGTAVGRLADAILPEPAHLRPARKGFFGR